MRGSTYRKIELRGKGILAYLLVFYSCSNGSCYWVANTFSSIGAPMTDKNVTYELFSRNLSSMFSHCAHFKANKKVIHKHKNTVLLIDVQEVFQHCPHQGIPMIPEVEWGF